MGDVLTLEHSGVTVQDTFLDTAPKAGVNIPAVRAEHAEINIKRNTYVVLGVFHVNRMRTGVLVIVHSADLFAKKCVVHADAYAEPVCDSISQSHSKRQRKAVGIRVCTLYKITSGKTVPISPHEHLSRTGAFLRAAETVSSDRQLKRKSVESFSHFIFLAIGLIYIRIVHLDLTFRSRDRVNIKEVPVFCLYNIIFRHFNRLRQIFRHLNRLRHRLYALVRSGRCRKSGIVRLTLGSLRSLSQRKLHRGVSLRRCDNIKCGIFSKRIRFRCRFQKEMIPADKQERHCRGCGSHTGDNTTPRHDSGLPPTRTSGVKPRLNAIPEPGRKVFLRLSEHFANLVVKLSVCHIFIRHCHIPVFPVIFPILFCNQMRPRLN